MEKIKKAKKVKNLRRQITKEEIRDLSKKGWIISGMQGELLCKKGHRININTGF